MIPLLTAVEATERNVAGGKAASLAKLATAGFDLPEFLVLTDAAFSEDDGQTPIDGLDATLAEHLPGIGAGPYAVRSSARDEDGSEHSHAGQFESFLNIAADSVLTKASEVRASGMKGRIEAYRRERGLKGKGLPAVIIQNMIPARTAGVAFSADPVSGSREQAVISATEGLGETLVGGEVDGETWVIDQAGHVHSAPEKPQVLGAEEAKKIADLARRAEDMFGAPQDIEWAFEGDRLVILQSRDITTDLRPLPAPDAALVVFDNSNIVESYPGIVSPLTYSFASYCYNRVYRRFVSLLGLSAHQIDENAAVFANLLVRVDCRVYYNLGNWYRALALLPGFSLNREFMETMMGVSEPLPEELTDRLAPPPATGMKRALETLRLGWIALGLLWQAAVLPRTRARFLDRLSNALRTAPPLDAANLTDLAAHYRAIEASLLDRWDAPLVNDFLCMIGFGASRKLLETWAGENGLAFHNDIMIGQGDIISAEPAQRIAQMAAIARRTEGADAALAGGRAALGAYPDLGVAFDSYIEKFGDRCTQELKLESTSLTDDPAPLIAAVRAQAAMSRIAPPDRPKPDWVAILPNRPVRRAVARWLTNWARYRVRDRENLRFERTRIFGHARRVFLAMGRELHAHDLIDAPRDIFLLTVQEVLGVIEGAAVSPDLKGLVSLRRAEMYAAGTRPDPPERILLRGPAVAPISEMTEFTPTTAEGDSRQGTGCSAGTVRAAARVIRDPRKEGLSPGEILIAPSTDPGWIAVFANASGIVVERGSLLSHSAIVARELGIPCVVGISDATRWLQSGDQIELNGSNGLVRKLDV